LWADFQSCQKELFVESQWIGADEGHIADMKERKQESETGAYENGNKRAVERLARQEFVIWSYSTSHHPGHAGGASVQRTGFAAGPF
jgi:hypothetical protein